MPRKLTIAIIATSSGYQQEHAEAFAAGLRANGDEPLLTRVGYANCDAVVCWGWRRGRNVNAQGKDALILERGYLGDRSKWTSMGWNGLNGRADFRLPALCDPSRFERLFGHTMKPWKDGGDYVLIMGQKPGDMSLGGSCLTPWYKETAQALREIHGLPVFLRPHPVALKQGKWVSPPGVEIMDGTLEDALEGAALCVTWNSNSATEAVMAGVPTIVMDIGAPAYPVTGHKLTEIIRPDRRIWAERLAWCQWSLDEIATGEPWARLRTLIDRQT